MARKVAVISGASSGIGKETAALLVEAGWRVFAFNRGKADIPGVESVTVDITKTEDIRRGVEAVKQQAGRVDLLVNNAGMGIAGASEDTSDESAFYQMDVNFFGAFRLAREVLPLMREQGGGRIVNVSSIAAVFFVPFQGFYSASKAAVNALFTAMQNEVRPFGILISNVMPGDTKTGFTDNRRKCADASPVYRERMEHSVAVMEKDERNGMPARAVAREILRQAARRKPKPFVTVGFKNKTLVFLSKILPAALVNRLVYSIYG